MCDNRKCIRTILLISILVLFTAALVFESYRGTTQLLVVNYMVSTKFLESVRIVQLSDLHGWTFGEGNTDLIAQVEAMEPDLVVMTGDMMDASDENADVVCDLIRGLVNTAPVYYGYGNHEYTWMKTHKESLTPALEAAGATVLDVSYMDITVNGQPVRIGGYHGYWKQPSMFEVTQEQWQREFDFTLAFEDTDRFKILLNHIPTPWLDWEYIDDFAVDLVLTGHYHGGQLRLPVLGGLYAPYVGLFPRYTEGMFTGEKAACILSAGLGASPGIPRINNLPQIVVVDLTVE